MEQTEQTMESNFQVMAFPEHIYDALPENEKKLLHSSTLEKGKSRLEHAVERSCPRAIELYIKDDYSFAEPDLLELAVDKDNMEVITILVKAYKDANMDNVLYGSNLLHRSRSLEVCKLFHGMRFDINGQEFYRGVTPLFSWCELENGLEIVRWALSVGAYPDIGHNDGVKLRDYVKDHSSPQVIALIEKWFELTERLRESIRW